MEAPQLQQEQDDGDWSLLLDATLNTRYVWRGLNFSDGWVFQPSATLGYEGFSLSVWGNMELTNVNVFPGHGDTAGDFTELDYTLDYSWAWRDLNFSVGSIYYDFPNTGAASTLELYGAVGLDTFLSPTLTVYQDVKEADGTYATLGVSHAFEDLWRPHDDISASLQLDGSLGFGSSNFNKFYYGVDQNAALDLLLSASLPVQMGENWSLTPAIHFSSLLDDDVRSTVGDASNFWGGLSLSYTF